MGLDGFYLSYASVCLAGSPPFTFTFCSSCSETVLSRVSLVHCVSVVSVACWIAEDRCVCHANVSWYPRAYDIVSTLWKKPQTLAIKSTSVSNNNVLYVTRLYVGEICGGEKKQCITVLWKTPIGHQVVDAEEPASWCHLPYVAFTW